MGVVASVHGSGVARPGVRLSGWVAGVRGSRLVVGVMIGRRLGVTLRRRPGVMTRPGLHAVLSRIQGASSGERHKWTNKKRCVSVGPPPPHTPVHSIDSEQRQSSNSLPEEEEDVSTPEVPDQVPLLSPSSEEEEAAEETRTTNLRGCVRSLKAERQVPIFRCETTTTSNIRVKFSSLAKFSVSPRSLLVFVSFCSFVVLII